MTGLLRAELRKIVTTRVWWIVLIGTVVLSGGYAAAVAALAMPPAGGGSPFADAGMVLSVYHGGNPPTRVLVLVLGIAMTGGEYRHGTLAATYLATPRRGRVIVGKAIALMLFGLFYGLVSVAVGLAVSFPFVLTNDGSFFLGEATTWRSLVLGVGSLALWSMAGMGIGLLIKNQLVAMLVGISFAFLVEPVVSLILFFRGLDGPLNLLPTGATNALLGVSSPVLFAGDAPIAWWVAGFILIAWLLTPALVGLVSVNEDVT